MTPAQTILVAAHDDDVLTGLNEQLESTNYALLHATNGEDAIALLERLKSKIEVAIIDLDLSDFGGWNLIGRLKIHDRKPVKIIVITASIHAKDVFEEMKDLGIDAVMRKPIPHDEWRSTLETVMARS